MLREYRLCSTDWKESGRSERKTIFESFAKCTWQRKRNAGSWFAVGGAVAPELSNQHMLASNANLIFGTTNEPIIHSLPATAAASSAGIQHASKRFVRTEFTAKWYLPFVQAILFGLHHYLLMLEIKYLLFSYLVERQLNDYHFCLRLWRVFLYFNFNFGKMCFSMRCVERIVLVCKYIHENMEKINKRM